MNQIDLNGRIAIVTGGAQGIGFATAQRFLQSGAAVVLWDVDGGRLDAAVQALAAFGEVSADLVELTDEAAVASATAAVVARHGRIDILVNNAGITGGNAPTWELEPAVWRRVVEVNLIAPFLTCRAVVPHMLAHGYGRIVNIASVAGKEGNPNASHYSGGAHGDLRPDDARAYPVHAQQDPDGPLPGSRPGGGDDRLAGIGRLRVLDRRGV